MGKLLNKMFFIILAGEAIFMLPFMVPRLYRPLMLEAWNLTNTDIGIAFAAYGICAMISYLIGGPFADKFHPRILISLSLALTSLGSISLVFFPSATSLTLTYAFFGVSTILFMWGALIKTTHILGGEDNRSSAQGVLDGGRGLVAALTSTLLVLMVTFFFPKLEGIAAQTSALRTIYFFTAGLTLFSAFAVWFSLRHLQVAPLQEKSWTIQKAIACLRNKDIWLLSIAILSAYCGYKSVDNYSIYLVDVHNLDHSSSSTFTSLVFWLRPLAAITTGFASDIFQQRKSSGRFVVLLALLVLCGLSQVALAFTSPPYLYWAFATVLASAALAYGMRAVYFSVLGDLNIPNHLVGTAVGIASFVGFLPDLFFGYMTGRWIDTYPGAQGYQYSFIFTATSLIVGALACLLLYRRAQSRTATELHS